MRATDGRTEPEAERLEREAARLLDEALSTMSTLHEKGWRERFRSLLEAAIQHAGRALAIVPGAGARSTLVRAHAARAEDALHGAGQLSLSAQRAPTLEACEDGWARVESIVQVAEESARVAVTVAAQLQRDGSGSVAAKRALILAQRAEVAAVAARRVVEERNHAYTFHTDGGFSFGEGWYLAAAAVLAGVAVQLEPGQPGTAQAERFLLDAGLGERLTAYRSRPRAMKHTTELVGRAFRSDPAGAQRRLRAAFLGDGPVAAAVAEWIDARLAGAPSGKKALLWIRDGTHDPGRNTSLEELVELSRRVERAGLVPVWTGDAVPPDRIPESAVDFILFWKDPLFRQLDQRRAQLHFFEHLRQRHRLVGQLGVTTAGMDGPALMGLPTLYLTDEPNVRMREWVGAVPGYHELVRGADYLERVSRLLSEWAGT